MIEILNWRKFQHYNTRRPPWIKLHDSLLDSAQWMMLSGDESKLLIEIWLTASRDSNDGKINMTPELLAWRLRRDSKLLAEMLNSLKNQGFITYDSVVLATRKQSAMPEREGETERETKTEGEGETHARFVFVGWDRDFVINTASSPDVGVSKKMAEECFDCYASKEWHDSNGNPVGRSTNGLKCLLRAWKTREPSMNKKLTDIPENETPAEKAHRLIMGVRR